MSNITQPTVGRIVIFHPGDNPNNPIILPNGMTEAAAIVTQVFEPAGGVQQINLTIFVADPLNGPTIQGWSVSHKDQTAQGLAYWTWPERV